MNVRKLRELLNVFNDFDVSHFEFKMAEILIQNFKWPIVGIITMKYEIKTLQILATRDSWKCERWLIERRQTSAGWRHRNYNAQSDDHGHHGGKKEFLGAHDTSFTMLLRCYPFNLWVKSPVARFWQDLLGDAFMVVGATVSDMYIFCLCINRTLLQSSSHVIYFLYE